MKLSMAVAAMLEPLVCDGRHQHETVERSSDAASADLCNEVGRKLYHYPLWKKKLLQIILLQDFGANPDQMIELCGLTEHYNMTDGEKWNLEAGSEAVRSEVPAARPKAKAYSAYRCAL